MNCDRRANSTYLKLVESVAAWHTTPASVVLAKRAYGELDLLPGRITAGNTAADWVSAEESVRSRDRASDATGISAFAHDVQFGRNQVVSEDVGLIAARIVPHDRDGLGLRVGLASEVERFDTPCFWVVDPVASIKHTATGGR